MVTLLVGLRLGIYFIFIIFIYLVPILIPCQFILHDANRVLATEFTDDDLHDFQRLIVPLMSNPRAGAAHDDGPLVVQVMPDDFPALLAIIQDGNYDQGSTNRLRSILACIAEITIVPFGHHTSCRVQVYLHCDYEPRAPM